MTGAAALVAALWLSAAPRVDTPQGPRPGVAGWCGECHWREHGQWAPSRHAVAGTNSLYRANHAQEPLRWCDSCHVPSGDVEEGVGCAACHVREGVVHTTRVPTADGLAAHAMVTDAALGTPEACAPCHTVLFPVGRHEPVTLSRFAMQDTMNEWRATGTDKPCQACHVAAGDHAMTGGHDVGKLKETLTVEVRRLGGREVRVRFTSRGAAHAVPTGDPFRALRVEFCADEACARVVATTVAGRTIAPVGPTWRITRDWSIPPPKGETAQRALELEVPDEASFYRVVLEWVGPSTARLLPLEETEAELFTGKVLPAEPAAP